MYALIVLVLFLFVCCQADVDNAQRRKLVNFYRV